MEYELRKEVLNFEGVLRDRVQRKLIAQPNEKISKKKTGVVAICFGLFLLLLIATLGYFVYNGEMSLAVFEKQLAEEKLPLNDDLDTDVLSQTRTPKANLDFKENKRNKIFIEIAKENFPEELVTSFCIDRNNIPDFVGTDQFKETGMIETCFKLAFLNKIYDVEKSMFFDKKELPENRFTDSFFDSYND